MTTDTQRDWPGDAAAHELGNYQNMCCACKRLFIGSRGRVVCRECATRPDSVRYSADFEQFVERLAAVGVDGRQHVIAASFREGWARGENKVVGEYQPAEDVAFAAFLQQELGENLDYSLGKWGNTQQALLWRAWYAQKTRLYQLFVNALDKSVTDTVEESAKVCESRRDSLMNDPAPNVSAGNEAQKCASAIRHVAGAKWKSIKDWWL